MKWVSVLYSEDGAVFGFGVAAVVDPRGGNGTMPQHFLNFLYVCVVIERIGGGGVLEQFGKFIAEDVGEQPRTGPFRRFSKSRRGRHRSRSNGRY